MRGCGLPGVAPLTWGGIIGNFRTIQGKDKRIYVAPLTWGGIIGNFLMLVITPAWAMSPH